MSTPRKPTPCKPTPCKTVEQWISVSVDGETLQPEASERLSAHIEECAACRTILEAEQRQASLLSAALASDAGVRGLLKDKILRQARSSAGGEVVRPSWERWSGAPGRSLGLAAAALLVAVVGWWAFSRPTPEPPPSLPWEISHVETQYVEDPPEAPDGTRWGHERQRVRSVLFDPQAPLGPPKGVAPDAAGFEQYLREPDVFLERERVNERHFQFAGWNYH